MISLTTFVKIFLAALLLECSSATYQYMLYNSDVYESSVNLTEPTAIYSSDGRLTLTLHVKAFRFTSAAFSFTTRAYCYNSVCSVPGPSIYLKAGDLFNLTLVNDLAADSGAATIMNKMHTPNRTNLHTHGLRVDPNVDSITVSIAGGGDSHTYEYKIPSDHAPGVHWYHSHLHGTSAFQVMGGLTGAMIIEPATTSVLPTALRSMRRKLLFFNHIFLNDSNSEPSGDPFTGWSYNKLSTQTGNKLAMNAQYHRKGIRDAWFVNGQYMPTFYMQPSEWVIFDMVCASGDRILAIEIRTLGAGKGSFACDTRLLAMDGVYLNKTRSGIYVKHLPLIQAQRASIAVRCSNKGTYYLQSNGNSTLLDYAKLGDIEIQTVQNLMFLKVTGDNMTTSSSPPTYLNIPYPDYLTSLLTQTVPASQVWSMSVEQTGCCDDKNAISWLGMGSNCTLDCFGRQTCEAKYSSSWTIESLAPVTSGQCTYNSYPGELGTSSIKHRFNATIGKVYDLELWGRGVSTHPMHIHVSHFQIAEYQSKTAPYYGAIGEWRDTWPATEGRSTLRMKFEDYEGEYITHCHYLKHEDLGMMASFSVVNRDPTMSPTPVPTLTPTLVPTRTPTESPTTSTPTVTPTRTPTVTPTMRPTTPTSQPSAQPSASPTQSPSTAFVSQITFSVTSTLTAMNLTSYMTNKAANDAAYKTSVAKIMGIASRSLNITGYASVRRRLEEGGARELAGNDVEITTEISVVSQSVASTDSAAYEELTTLLTTATNSGTLLTTLKSESSNYQSVSATVNTYSDYTVTVLHTASPSLPPTSPPSSASGSSSSSSDMTVIIAASAGGGGGLLIITILLYLYHTGRLSRPDKASKSVVTSDKREVKPFISSGNVVLGDSSDGESSDNQVEFANVHRKKREEASAPPVQQRTVQQRGPSRPAPESKYSGPLL